MTARSRTSSRCASPSGATKTTSRSRAGSWCTDLGDRRELLWLELGHLQILAHVRRILRAGQRQHPELTREAEDDLRRRLAARRRDGAHARMREHVTVRGQQREALIDHAVLRALRADLGIP